MGSFVVGVGRNAARVRTGCIGCSEGDTEFRSEVRKMRIISALKDSSLGELDMYVVLGYMVGGLVMIMP